jgi:hypothetical protein
MKPLFVLVGMVFALTVPAGLATSAAAAPPAAPPAAGRPAAAPIIAAPSGMDDLEVTFDRDRVRTVLGGRFTLETRIVNTGRARTDPILAHLNVASLTSDVYVDPEDWSAERSQTVPPLAAGASTSLVWKVQAVNAGSFDAYVVLLPNGVSSAGKGPLVVSPPVHLAVAGRRTLSPGGAMPVVVAVPVLLGLVAAATRFRVRRTG